MLVVFSDLHFQDTSNDDLEWKGGRVFLERNIGRKAYQRFFDREIARFKDVQETLGQRAAGNKLHIVIAGDCFDLHRSPLWFRGGNNFVTRFDELEKSVGDYSSDDDLDEDVEGLLLEVMKDMEYSNPHVLGPLGEFHRLRNEKSVDISVHLVPGNHEHELHRSYALRAKARELLGLPEFNTDENGNPVQGDNTFPKALHFEEYETCIRHGHEYDRINFSMNVPDKGAYDPPMEAYRATTVGDVFTTEFAVRLATSYRARNAIVLRQDDGSGQARISREMYRRILAFDDLRNYSDTVDYIVSGFQKEQDETSWSILVPVLQEVACDLLGDERLIERARNLQDVPYLLQKAIKHDAIRAGLAWFVKQIDSKALAGCLSLIDRFHHKDNRKKLERMLRDVAFERGARLLVCGHTHDPGVHVLRHMRDGTPLTHIDVGTWRKKIEDAADDRTFVTTDAMTYVEIFNETEQKHASKRHYNFWSGRRPEERDEDRIAPPPEGEKRRAWRLEERATPNNKKVTFKKVSVVRIDEGKRGRAELRLDFGAAGVNAARQTLYRDTVNNGDELEPGADEKSVTVTPSFSGFEVFSYGYEEDGGKKSLDPDDILPSASRFFAIDERGKDFSFRVKGANGELEIWFDIEDV